MKKRSFLYLIAYVVSILAVGLACAALSGTPTTEPTSNPPTQQSLPPTSDNSTSVTSTNPAASTGSDLVTFTDQNNYYQIDVPSEWVHTQTTNDYGYIDTFTSPDKGALVENIVHDEGISFQGGINGKYALQLLNQGYSNTGKEGDIKVTNDSIQKDGSERLTWSSKGGKYSGVSFFEVRKKTTFLMFTVLWDDQAQSTYVDVLDKVISSYRIP